MFAGLSCTLGMFGISRFAILTIDFGAVFIVQFLLLSLVFGIPIMTFFASVGQYLGSGVVDMWRISPIFQGVGISIMLTHAVYGLYNIACLSWLFAFLRDSFISNFDQYRWTLCFPETNYNRGCEEHLFNGSVAPLEQTIPDYFSGVALKRASPLYPQGSHYSGDMRFQTLFHIIVIWMALFIGLSTGLKSYGKVCVLFGLAPVAGFLVFSTKIIGLMPWESFQHWFYASNWEGFTTNGQSWICAARECFFTWCFLGGVMIQLGSHNKFRHQLIRDTTLIVIVTLGVLMLAGSLGVALGHIISHSGYKYGVSSFETYHTYGFLKKMPSRHARLLNNLPTPAAYKRARAENTAHISFLAGIRILEPGRDQDKYSGYQVMRLSTELVPSVAAILGPRLLSPLWVALFYFSMILFGLAQQLAVCHTVVSGLLAVRPEHFLEFESALTFITCLLGLVFCFPMATELGIYVVYFLDYVIGCAWWIIILYLIQVFAMFVIRSKAYGADRVVTVLFKPKQLCSQHVGPLLAFIWHVILPVGLLVLGIVSFKTGHFDEMFDWTSPSSNYHYLPSWVRELGAMLQILPLIMVPFVAIVQSCRYYLYGPQDLYNRVQLLYRPTFANQREQQLRSTGVQRNVVLTNFSSNNNTPTRPLSNDPPPKYTPPPSYSTATGARLARFLRQSFRQSVRRIRDITTNNPVALSAVDSPDHIISGGSVAEASARKPSSNPVDQEAPPPDYATVVIEAAGGQPTQADIEFDPTVTSFNSGIANSAFSLDSDFPLTSLSSFRSSRQPLSLITTPAHTTLQSFHNHRFGDEPRSLGRSVIQSSSFRHSLPSDCEPLSRVDSEAILIHSAEPIDRIRPSRDSDYDLYSKPVGSLLDRDQITPSRASTMSLGRTEMSEIEARSGGSSSEDEIEMAEARNINIIGARRNINMSSESDTIVLEMDMSTSVI